MPAHRAFKPRIVSAALLPNSHGPTPVERSFFSEYDSCWGSNVTSTFGECCSGAAELRRDQAYGFPATLELGPFLDPSLRALAARARAKNRWYVYLILCRGGAIYTGIARDVAVRYAQHVAGTGARYTRANPPARLLVRIACMNQSEASRMEAAIKKLPAINKRKLVGKTDAGVRRLLFG